MKKTRQDRKPPTSWTRAADTRDKIVEYLTQPKSRDDIALHAKISRAVTSYHLGVLRKAGRVKMVGKGNAAKYVKE